MLGSRGAESLPIGWRADTEKGKSPMSGRNPSPVLRGFECFVLSALIIVASGFVGCNTGGRDGGGAGIPGLGIEAAHLDEDGRSYAGPPLDTARYGHTATALENGQVLIAGGSDERFLTSLETAEIFDQSLIDDPAPESISGAFVITNFNGDSISMVHGGRVLHTATRLPNGNVRFRRCPLML